MDEEMKGDSDAESVKSTEDFPNQLTSFADCQKGLSYLTGVFRIDSFIRITSGICMFLIDKEDQTAKFFISGSLAAIIEKLQKCKIVYIGGFKREDPPFEFTHSTTETDQFTIVRDTIIHQHHQLEEQIINAPDTQELSNIEQLTPIQQTTGVKLEFISTREKKDIHSRKGDFVIKEGKFTDSLHHIVTLSLSNTRISELDNLIEGEVYSIKHFYPSDATNMNLRGSHCCEIKPTTAVVTNVPENIKMKELQENPSAYIGHCFENEVFPVSSIKSCGNMYVMTISDGSVVEGKLLKMEVFLTNGELALFHKYQWYRIQGVVRKRGNVLAIYAKFSDIQPVGVSANKAIEYARLEKENVHF